MDLKSEAVDALLDLVKDPSRQYARTAVEAIINVMSPTGTQGMQEKVEYHQRIIDQIYMVLHPEVTDSAGADPTIVLGEVQELKLRYDTARDGIAQVGNRVEAALAEMRRQR
jgi:hypothetical protein